MQVSPLDVAKEHGHTEAVAVVEQLMGSAIAGLSAGEFTQVGLRSCLLYQSLNLSHRCEDQCIAGAQVVLRVCCRETRSADGRTPKRRDIFW